MWCAARVVRRKYIVYICGFIIQAILHEPSLPMRRVMYEHASHENPLRQSGDPKTNLPAHVRKRTRGEAVLLQRWPLSVMATTLLGHWQPFRQHRAVRTACTTHRKDDRGYLQVRWDLLIFKYLASERITCASGSLTAAPRNTQNWRILSPNRTSRTWTSTTWMTF